MKTKSVILLLVLSMLVIVSCKTKTGGKFDHKGGKAIVVYKGVVPCADCEGIETAIVLGDGNTYLLQTRYLGKDDKVFESEGTFNYDEKSKILTLENENEYTPSKYLFEKGRLIQLDMNGNRITGALSSYYILPQQEYSDVTNRYWQLIELNGKKIDATEMSFREPFMIIDTKEGRVSGNNSCNSFTGSFELDNTDNSIRFSKIATTKMACLDENIEREFLDMLERVDNFSLNGHILTLKADKEASAVFKAIYVK